MDAEIKLIRGDIHPVTKKRFWGMNRGWEWWVTEEQYHTRKAAIIVRQRGYRDKNREKNNAYARKYARRDSEKNKKARRAVVRLFKRGDINMETGLRFWSVGNFGRINWLSESDYQQEVIREYDRKRKWFLDNPELAKAAAKRNYWRDPVKSRQKANARPKTEKKRARSREWGNKNRDKKRALDRNWRRNKRKEDPVWSIRMNLGSRISDLLKGKSFKKDASVMKALGCTRDELRVYLEGLFLPDMTWKNYGLYKKDGPRTWHVDHITPGSLAKTKEDVLRLYHYTNLRPLWALDNIIKSDFLPCGRRARELNKTQDRQPGTVAPVEQMRPAV